MPGIHQLIFGGIKPAVDSENQQPQQASLAHNTQLRDTTVRPFNEPQLHASQKHIGDPDVVRELHMFPDSEDCCWSAPITFERDTSVLTPVDPGACPGFEGSVMFPCNCEEPYRYFRCEDETYPLIVPQPLKTPRVTLIDAGTMKDAPINEHKEPDQRSYTYTWVDRFGVESPPAIPSAPFLAWDDQSFDIDNLDTPPTNAVCLRLYRAVSPWNLDPNSPINIEGSFQLVEEIAVPLALPYRDDRCLKDLDFGTLNTMSDCAPPCMDQVVLTEEGYGVGFHKNQLFVSERFELHSFPHKNRITIPDRIVGLAAFYDTVFVVTTGRPYRINIRTVNADGQADTAIDVLPFPQTYPCLSRFALVTTSFGAMYPSHKGMVAVAQEGGAVLLTRDRIDEDDWLKYMPNVGAWHQGKYYGARSPVGNGFIMDVVDEGEGRERLDIGDFITIDWNPQAVHSGPDGRLWYLDGDSRVLTWHEGAGRLGYTWRSKQYRQDGLMQFAAAKVVGNYGPPVRLTIFVDGREFDSLMVRNNKPFRLRRNGRGIIWSFQIEGATTVREVHVATSMAELTEQ